VASFCTLARSMAPSSMTRLTSCATSSFTRIDDSLLMVDISACQQSTRHGC
jgi:hypothetical protein